MMLRDGGVVSDEDRVLRIYKSKWLWADVFFALPWEPIWAIIMRPPVQPKVSRPRIESDFLAPNTYMRYAQNPCLPAVCSMY